MMESAFSFYTGLATYLALCATIYKVCEKGDTLITDDTKLAIAVWILDLKPGKAVQNWPGTFTHWFDKIFGEKHLSWKCFFRSSIASVVSAILVTLIWIALRPDEASFVWESERAISRFIIYLPLSVFLLNLIPDYISLLETRYILGKMAQTDSGLKHILLLTLDAALTLVISALIPVLLLSLFWDNILDLLGFRATWMIIAPFSPQSYITEVLPLTGHSIIFNTIGFPFLSICFYTTFLTSVWIWGYVSSGLLLKLFSFVEFVKEKINLSEKPLSAIGTASILTITAIASLAWVSPKEIQMTNIGIGTNQDIFYVREAVDMIKGKQYFDRRFNSTGQGIKNDYEDRGAVIYDKATKLYWQKGGSNWMAFEEVGSYVDSLNRAKFGGYDDWRLPTLEEAMSLMEPNKNEDGLYIDPMFDSAQKWIWTVDRGNAWVVLFDFGNCDPNGLDSDNAVRAVRSGA